VSEILIFTYTTFWEVVLLQPLGNCKYKGFVIFFLRLVSKVDTLTHTFCYYSSEFYYEGWNFNSGNYLFTTDTK